jgi:hypothetical protein
MALLALLVASAAMSPASAAPSPALPTARLSVSRVAIGAGGGTVTVEATVRNGRTCAWTATPTIAGFQASGACRTSLLRRSADIPSNSAQVVRRFVFVLTVSGVHGRVTARIAVGQEPSTPPAPATTSPPSCTPISDEGTCYEPGEFCRDSDHGDSGVAGDGETILCEDNDGWRWEPTG